MATHGPEPRRRVNILAYPSPSTGTFVLLIAALLSVGTFAGSWAFNLLQGRDWVLAIEACSQTATAATAGRPDSALAYQDVYEACIAPLEQRRGLWSVAGAAAMAVGAAALVVAMPQLLVRRHRLRPLPPAAAAVAERAAQLASAAGLRRPPRLMAGPTGMADAFTFGTPWTYRLALPLKAVGLLARPGPADGVLRHEFAHVAHRDVELTWLARSAWFIVLPVLALPVAGAVLARDASLLGAYLWRAVIVAGVVQLITGRTLRAREFDADQRAGSHAPALLAQTLALIPTGRRHGGLRRLLARHPDPARRLSALTAPHTIVGVSPVDGLIAGFLAALAAPLLVQTGTALFTGSTVDFAGQWAAAGITGPVLGATVGFGVWRAELVAAAADDAGWPGAAPPPPAAVGCGLAAGLALGHLVSIGQIGAQLTGLDVWTSLAAPVLCSAGATVLTAGLAALVAHWARRVGSPLPLTVLGLTVSIAVFTAGSWVWSTLQLALGFGWDIALVWLASGYATWPVMAAALAAVLVSAAGLFRLGRGAESAPAWAYLPEPAADLSPVPSAGARTAPVVLAVGGGAGVLGAVAHVLVVTRSGPPVDADTAFLAQAAAVLVSAAAAAVAASLLGAALSGGAGAGQRRARAGAQRRRLAGGAPAAAALAGAVSLGGFAAALAADFPGRVPEIVLGVVAPTVGAGFVLGLAASGAVAILGAGAAVVRRLLQHRQDAASGERSAEQGW